MAASDVVEAQKDELRIAMARLKREVSAGDARKAGESMAAALVSSPEWTSARGVGLFAGLPDEPDTRPIFSAVRESGKTAFLPRCREEGDVELVPVEEWSDLRAGYFGILEPPAGVASVSLAELDLLLLPGVAFDPYGRRLGRGKGFYDRTLGPDPEPRLIGVAYAFQVVERVPTHAHDRRVHAILDETGLRAAQPAE